MSELLRIIEDFKSNCPCGKKHETAIRDVRIESGLVHRVGDILRSNGFEKTLLLVADKNTFAAADGIMESLDGFTVELKIYDFLRVATMDHVCEVEKLISGRNISILSVGTG